MLYLRRVGGDDHIATPPFNSLFEMPGLGTLDMRIGALRIRLSILYLRCHELRAGCRDVLPRPAFNSLFEMLLEEMRAAEESECAFNSLFEMLCICRGGGIGGWLNSLSILYLRCIVQFVFAYFV